MIVLYEHNETEFTSQGLGVLSDASSCVVTEELNGGYELELEYPVNGIHFSDITSRRIILAKPNATDEPQPFRIYEVSKPTSGVVTFNAQHISYDLTDLVVDPAKGTTERPLLTPKVFHGPQDFFGTVNDCLVTGQSSPFTFSTELQSTKEMTVSVPKSVRSLMGDEEGGVRELWPDGEYYYDRFIVEYKQSRGADRGVEIRYGKNLTSLKQDENCAEVYTGIYPYWYKEDDGLQWLGDYNTPIVNVSDVFPSRIFDYERIQPVDLTNEISEDQESDTDPDNDGDMPSQATLREKAIEYIRENDMGVPKVSLDVSFVSLRNAREYEEISVLEDIRLGDLVTVIFPKLGVDTKAECVKTVYNCITDSYDSVELGEPTKRLSDTIAEQGKPTVENNTTVSYTWTAFADDITGKNLTGTDEGDKKYIGFSYNHLKETYDPQTVDPSIFEWSLRNTNDLVYIKDILYTNNTTWLYKDTVLIPSNFEGSNFARIEIPNLTGATLGNYYSDNENIASLVSDGWICEDFDNGYIGWAPVGEFARFIEKHGTEDIDGLGMLMGFNQNDISALLFRNGYLNMHIGNFTADINQLINNYGGSYTDYALRIFYKPISGIRKQSTVGNYKEDSETVFSVRTDDNYTNAFEVDHEGNAVFNGLINRESMPLATQNEAGAVKLSDIEPGISTYTHVQSTPATVWTINHNLGRYPSVTILDSANSEIVGDYTFVSLDRLQVQFAVPFAGTAYLS